MNLIKKKMENFRNGKDKLEDFLKREREKNKYDPRSDLEKDHKYWQAVLKKAAKVDRQLYGNLHGFRCIGAKLKKEGNGLKLITKHLIGDFWENKQEWLEDRKEYLLPYKEEITAIFKKIA